MPEMDGVTVASPMDRAGMAYSAERERMVKEHLCAPGRRIRDERVLAAMRRVPRHCFVPEDMQDLAYSDRPLPIGHDQTISQPFIVALMTQALELKASDRVLEIGTGSGYQAAVLGELVAEVFSVEIVESLGERAARVLSELGCGPVRTRIGDGHIGWPEEAPFDAILLACAPERVPEGLLDQLGEGGRMIVPVGGVEKPQELLLLRKRGEKVIRESLIPVRFVPMTGKGVEDEMKSLAEKDKASLLLFDGVCHLCEGSVQFILQHERDSEIRFVPIQSELGRRLYSKAGLDPEAPSAMLFVEGGETFEGSEAALRVAAHLGGWPRLALVGRLLPRFLRDGVYRFVARNRYRWFGKRESCLMPEPGQAERFLG